MSSPSPPHVRDPPAPAPMETPAPEEPQTLAAGELVWARAKGRQSWWPARLRKACPVARSSSRADALVSCFGEGGPLHATQVRRFADPAADGMARAITSRALYTAVEEARACAVALLCRDLSCACPRASPPGAPEPETEGSVGVANLGPSEFLASLRDAAALDVSYVGFVDRALLDSWVRAVARLGWGPAGAGQHPRRSVDQLVDKIDLDVPAGDDRDAADWVAGEDEDLEEPQETPARKRRASTSYKRRTATARNRHGATATALKKGRSATAAVVNKRRSATALLEEMDAAEEDDQKNESGGTGTGLSEKRKREKRKSKYLMPPYTDVTQPYADEKWPDSPKELIDAPKDEKKVSLENVGAPEVLLLVRCFGENISQKNRFPKAAKGFLELFRSSVFSDPESVAAIVSDSCGAQKLGSCGMKRSRKKEKDGSGGPSTKRKIEKISPTSSIDCGVPITFATPIRQVRAEDMRSPLKTGGASRGMGDGVPDEKKRLVDMSPILAAMSGPMKPESDQDQANGESVLKTPVGARDALCDQSAKNSDEAVVEATKSDTDIEIDINLQSVASKDQVGPPDMNRLMDKRRVLAALFGTIQPERDPDQANSVSAVKPPLSAALSDQSAKNAGEAVVEATKSETDIEIDINLQSVAVKEQVGAPDMNRLMDKKRDVAALFGTIQPEREPDQANNGSAVKPPLGAALSDQSANKNDEGIMEVTKPETDIRVDTNLQSAVVDLPVNGIQLEATKPETDIQVDVNVPSVIVDVPVGTVRTEAMEVDHNIHVGTDELNEQSVAPDVPVGSGWLRDIPQPADVDKDKASEVCTVQESYASLEAMVPEMLTKVEGVTTGTSVIATKHAVKNDGQNSEQPNEEKSTDGAIANNSVKAANGSCPDLANSTHKKKAKKAPQRFENPAAIVLTFIDGFVLPSKERLLAEFRRFGFVIESETRFFKDSGGRCARVVFGKSAEAESAYNEQWTLGMFGPPYATVRLHYIDHPITLSNPPPASKPPLMDIRKNLENMISSLTDNSPVKKATSSAGPKPVYLLEEMQRLLAKVNEMLPGPSASDPP